MNKGEKGEDEEEEGEEESKRRAEERERDKGKRSTQEKNPIKGWSPPPLRPRRPFDEVQGSTYWF